MVFRHRVTNIGPMDSPEITSPSNRRVKAWVALDKRRVRDETDTFLIEGRREVERLAPHTQIVELIWCGTYAEGLVPGRATTVSSEVFDKISRRQHPDGVAAIARRPDLSLEHFAVPEPALVLVADGIEKPGNIGAVLRTCDALGAAFLGSSLGTDLTNPNVVRSAQGSLLAAPTASVDRAAAVRWCAANTEVIVTRPDADTRLWDIDLTQPVSVVIGSEDRGVGDAWDAIGSAVTIPMVGSADSLNASVTAAIVVAEAIRQRSV